MPGNYLLNLPQDTGPRLGDLSSQLLPFIIQQALNKKNRKTDMADQMRQAIFAAQLGGQGQLAAPVPGEGLTGGPGSAAAFARQKAEAAGFPASMDQLGQTDPYQLMKYWKAAPPQPSASISISPYSFSEKLQAQNILGATPKDLAGSEDYKGMVKRSGGLFGFGPGSKYVYKDQAAQNVMQGLQNEARNVIGGPGKVSSTVSGKFNGKPFIDLTRQADGSYGQPGDGGPDQETQALIDEYNTTDDLARLKELEKLLEAKGVTFE